MTEAQQCLLKALGNLAYFAEEGGYNVINFRDGSTLCVDRRTTNVTSLITGVSVEAVGEAIGEAGA